jgi:hypothetical protein
MSEDLKQILAPVREIPFDSAADFFISSKESTVEKTATQKTPEEAREAVNKAKGKGLLSGIRSSVHQDVTHATRIRRTRGSRVGKDVGTVGGALAGLAAGRKGGVAGKIGGSAIGAFVGRGAGKTIGEEIDRKRTLSRYDRSKAKKAEIEKRSSADKKPGFLSRLAGTRAARDYDIQKAMDFAREQRRKGVAGYENVDKVAHVRELWKLAQGGAPTDAVAGAEGATPSPGPVDVAGMSPEEAAAAGQLVPSGPKIKPPSGGPTPEELARSESEAQLEQDMVADQAAEQNAADYFKDLAEQVQSELAATQEQAQQAQMAADQAGQQAQMSQQQADMATQQLQAQAQQSAAEKEQLTQEMVSAKDTVMQMRQAMTAYRENLQQIALQDPVAMAGPSPEEQGMMAQEEAAAQEGAAPKSGKAAKQQQEATQAQDEAAKQTVQADQANAEDQVKAEASMAKQSGAVPELLVKEGGERFLGAMIGAAGGAGMQALSDRKGPREVSAREQALKHRLQSLQRKKSKTVFDKHNVTITRALYDTAKINRQHPGSAAAMAAITGAIAGAALGPTVAQTVRRHGISLGGKRARL